MSLGIFPAGALAPGLFPATYFGGSSGPATPRPRLQIRPDLAYYWMAAGPAATAAPAFDDLVDAVVARVQAALVAPGPLAWFGTGEAAAVLAPGTALTLPYAVLGEPDESDDYWNTSGDGTAEGHLEVACYAGTKKGARLLGDRVAALFTLDALRADPLLFSAGTLYYFRQSGRSASLDPDPAPGGGDCWAEIRQFHFMYSF